MTDAHTNNMGIITIDGSTYYIKDIEARAAITLAEGRIGTNETDIASLKAAVTNGAHFLGKVDTSTGKTETLVDGDHTTPIYIVGKATAVAPNAGDFIFIPSGSTTVELVWDGVAGGEGAGAYTGTWREFGSTGALKAMAFADEGTFTDTPQGSVSVDNATVVTDTVTNPTFTGTAKAPTGSFNGSEGNVSVSGTPTGTVSKPNVTVTPTTGGVNEVTITAPTAATETTPSNETLVIVSATKTFVSGVAAELEAAPTFSGDSLTSTGKFTPAGSLAMDNYTPEGTNSGTAVTLAAHNHSASFSGTEKTITVSPKTASAGA